MYIHFYLLFGLFIRGRIFGYRLTGVILFWITGWRSMLFFFPNVFENFVILCLIIFWLSKKKKLNFDPRHKTIMLGVLIIPKMIHEYFQHFLGRQPWEIYPFGTWSGLSSFSAHQVDWILWGTLLYVVPMAGFLLYIKDIIKQCAFGKKLNQPDQSALTSLL